MIKEKVRRERGGGGHENMIEEEKVEKRWISGEGNQYLSKAAPLPAAHSAQGRRQREVSPQL